MISAKTWIEKLELKPHPEGGFFNEILRSEEIIDKKAFQADYSGNRALYTSIYFLLDKTDISLFHRLKSDEMWHFYYGSSIIIHLFTSEGNYAKISVGNNIEKGDNPQVLIPKNSWFGAEVLDQNSYGLVGCTVVPAFEFADFEFGNREYLLKQFPDYKELILKFTK